MSNLPQDFYELVKLLDCYDIRTRWNAVVALARYRVFDDWKVAWDAIEERIEAEPNKALSGIMAQAISMISHRNFPYEKMLDFTPDFLSTYDEYLAGIEHPPSPQDWDRLDDMGRGT